MDSLVIYLIIAVVWIFQLLAKKREVEIEQRSAPSFPNVFIGNPDDEKTSECELEEIPQVVLPEPQVEVQPAGSGFSVSDLSDDVFEQGIILSAVLGPPRGQFVTSPGISRHLLLLR